MSIPTRKTSTLPTPTRIRRRRRDRIRREEIGQTQRTQIRNPGIKETYYLREKVIATTTGN